MSRLPRVTGKEVVSALKKAGFVVIVSGFNEETVEKH